MAKTSTIIEVSLVEVGFDNLKILKLYKHPEILP
jgi:hypothetical protein